MWSFIQMYLHLLPRNDPGWLNFSHASVPLIATSAFYFKKIMLQNILPVVTNAWSKDNTSQSDWRNVILLCQTVNMNGTIISLDRWETRLEIDIFDTWSDSRAWAAYFWSACADKHYPSKIFMRGLPTNPVRIIPIETIDNTDLICSDLHGSVV